MVTKTTQRQKTKKTVKRNDDNEIRPHYDRVIEIACRIAIDANQIADYAQRKNPKRIKENLSTMLKRTNIIVGRLNTIEAIQKGQKATK